MGPVNGLLFDGGIPPRVQKHHVIGFDEVEAEAAGLQRDEERVRIALTEAPDDSRSVRCRTVEVLGRDARLRCPFPRPGEETRELAEHENPVPLGGRLREQVDQHVELGRRSGSFPDQLRVEGELAQQGE